jgi:hypothetical protein
MSKKITKADIISAIGSEKESSLQKKNKEDLLKMLSVSKLKGLCSTNGIQGYSKLNKEGLVALIWYKCTDFINVLAVQKHNLLA